MGVRRRSRHRTETMAATNQLSIREENEICVMIAGELADLIDDGKVTHQEIRETLKQAVAMYGIGYPDDFYVGKVVFWVK